MRLHTPNQALRRLRPGELADLLEELGRDERQELLAQLEKETAADALEEMEPDHLGALRESTTERRPRCWPRWSRTKQSALRDLEADEAAELPRGVPAAQADRLRRAPALPRRSAGGDDDQPRVGRPDQTVGQVAAHPAQPGRAPGRRRRGDHRRRDRPASCTTSGCSSCSSRRRTTA
jgi:hypothetical protein